MKLFLKCVGVHERVVDGVGGIAVRLSVGW